MSTPITPLPQPNHRPTGTLPTCPKCGTAVQWIGYLCDDCWDGSKDRQALIAVSVVYPQQDRQAVA